MSRRATIRTEHEDPALLVRALRPDDTDEMETTVTGDGTLRTRIERETTAGLRSTVDDYVVNLDVALQVAQHDSPTDAGTASDTDDTSEHDNE